MGLGELTVHTVKNPGQSLLHMQHRCSKNIGCSNRADWWDLGLIRDLDPNVGPVSHLPPFLILLCCFILNKKEVNLLQS